MLHLLLIVEQSDSEEQVSWETKKDMQDKYPQLFVDSSTTIFLPYPISLSLSLEDE